MTDKAKKEGFDTTRFEIAPTEVVDGSDRELYRLLVLIACSPQNFLSGGMLSAMFPKTAPAREIPL